MASTAVHGAEPVAKYVGSKLSRVRWKPQPAGAVEPSEYFLTGSWDDEVNKVAVWYYKPSPSSSSSLSACDTELVCEVEVGGSDVMDMRFLDEERVVVGLSSGGVALLRFRPLTQTLTLSHQWDALHYIQTKTQRRPCTAIATSGITIVTGGEDGRINIVRADDPSLLRVIEKADNATVTGLVCSLHNDFLSSSSSGQLKVWDLRTPGNQAARILVIPGDTHSLQSLDRCPNQPHLVAVGRGNGSVCFWDLRQNKQPFSILQAHSADVWELQFHKLHPHHLFTCSQDSSLWHWDASLTPSHPPSSSSSHSSGPWLSGAVQHGKVDVSSILPNGRLAPNSFDIESRHLVCGTDSEMIYLVPDIVLR